MKWKSLPQFWVDCRLLGWDYRDLYSRDGTVKSLQQSWVDCRLLGRDVHSLYSRDDTRSHYNSPGLTAGWWDETSAVSYHRMVQEVPVSAPVSSDNALVQTSSLSCAGRHLPGILEPCRRDHLCWGAAMHYVEGWYPWSLRCRRLVDFDEVAFTSVLPEDWVNTLFASQPRIR